jgi:hypothetical protein
MLLLKRAPVPVENAFGALGIKELELAKTCVPGAAELWAASGCHVHETRIAADRRIC